MNFLPFFAGLLGFGVVWVLIPQILKFARQAPGLVRAPDFHHTHKAPVPRFGGLALAIAFLISELLLVLTGPDDQGRVGARAVVVLSCMAMFALGFWDDIRPLGAKRKLAGQILIAGLVWVCGLGVGTFKLPFTGTIINIHGWGLVFTIVWLVGMANLINLIDGVDGLAGGICLMLMLLTMYVGHQNGNFEMLAAGMAGALLAFLRFNFPPASIYLGDGGAYFLGFQIGLFALINSQKGTILAAMVAPLFVLALPILDTALAILRRGLRGLPVFRPDRRHIHHHLLGMGLSRRQVVLSIYSVTLLFLGLGLVAFWSRGKMVPALLGVAVIILLIFAGKLSFSREWFAVGRVVGNSLEMRGEIQYALSLTRWLAMEGDRCASVEKLWSDLLYAAQKLCFVSARLRLEDGERKWQDPEWDQPGPLLIHQLECGRSGMLELGIASPEEPTPEQCAPPKFVSVTKDDLSEILAELLAEAWIKGTRRWLNGAGTALRFDSPPSLSTYRFKRGRPGILPPKPKSLGADQGPPIGF